jgi:hypothetical protein
MNRYRYYIFQHSYLQLKNMRINNNYWRIYYKSSRGFSPHVRRHTNPPSRYCAAGVANKGGRPRRGGAAGDTLPAAVYGFSLSTDTESLFSAHLQNKNLSLRSNTL